MNSEHWKNMLPIIQAFANGETIQIDYGGGNWCDIENDEGMAFVGKISDYRIKPKMKVIKTRRALVRRLHDDELFVTLWSDSYPNTQEDWEEDSTFLRWLEDTQTHEIEI